MLQIKWYIKSNEINQLPKDNPETVPYVNPCIIVDNYNVFIIGGQTKNKTYLSTTWRAAFNVIPDQVCINGQGQRTRVGTCLPNISVFTIY